jgi:single-strand DNA-binding protein
MADVNSVTIFGRLGKDPEIKVLQSGNKVANFPVATTKKWKDQQGNPKEDTQWHTITAWGKTAEIAEQYLQKGGRVLIMGELRTDQVDDGQGNVKYFTKVVADKINLVDFKDNGQQQGAPAPQSAPAPQAAPAPQPAGNPYAQPAAAPAPAPQAAPAYPPAGNPYQQPAAQVPPQQAVPVQQPAGQVPGANPEGDLPF